MKNKDTINRIKNAAELAWASYGYFHLTKSQRICLWYYF